MSRFEALHPWCIVRLLPHAQRIVVARFRRRNDALAHQAVLQRLVKTATYIVIYDPPNSNELPGLSDPKLTNRSDKRV